MFAQLGNTIFTVPFGWDTYSKSDATTYAQHDIIGGKPVLQPTANELEEITIDISLHAEFCNVAQTIASLKGSKDTFEVLPLLFGDGRYAGDYVIISIEENYDETFDDGTPVRATVNLSLREYQVADKLSQQQNAARKNAFAVGNKKPITQNLVQPATIPQHGSVQMAAVNSESQNINTNVLQYQDNVSRQAYIKSQIQNSLTNINTNINAFNNQFSDMEYLFTNVQGVQTSVQAVTDAVTGFSFANISELQRSNLKLQQANQQMQIAIVPLNYNIIDRRA